MRYFDGLVDGSFKKDPSGRNLFYPWGILGSGYILESEQHYLEIRSIFKRWTIVALVGSFLVALGILFLDTTLSFDLTVVALLVVLALALNVYFVNKYTQGLKRSTEKLTCLESLTNSARSYHLVTLILLEISSLAFVGLGIWLIGYEKLLSICTVGFFGLDAILIGYMIFNKLKS